MSAINDKEGEEWEIPYPPEPELGAYDILHWLIMLIIAAVVGLFLNEDLRTVLIYMWCVMLLVDVSVKHLKYKSPLFLYAVLFLLPAILHLFNLL